MTPEGAADLTDFVGLIFEDETLMRMGHNQRREDKTLGLGWLYYAMGRLLHPARAVVIGSYRGFVPLLIARALNDSSEHGRVTFIDPSLLDDFWTDPIAVGAHFASFGVSNVDHVLATTQEFVLTDSYRALEPLGLVFIDGLHTAEQARFDYEAFAPLLASRGIVLFHDSMAQRRSRSYGPDREYDVNVTGFLAELRADPGLQLFDLPFGTGLTLVQRLADHAGGPLVEGRAARPRPGE